MKNLKKEDTISVATMGKFISRNNSKHGKDS